MTDPPEQLGLFSADTAAGNLRPESEFRAALAALLPPLHSIILTDNRSTLISVRPGGEGRRVVRVQRAFLAADDATLKALARFVVRPDRRCRQKLDDFLARRRELVESCSRPEDEEVETRGEHRDLARFLRRVQKDYGLRIPGVRIGWARPGREPGRRSIKFGSWFAAARLVRIHPALDDPAVPDYFVEYIIYHELLHALFPPEPGAGQRSVHNPEFQRFERKFARYAEARAFEREYVRTRLR